MQIVLDLAQEISIADNNPRFLDDILEEFPMISEELSKGDSRGLPSDYYGVNGIPEIFLIGKDGRIIATGLRGPTLRDTVEKQFTGKNTTTE